MKIIFSRKGFDSQYGGVPSPILPDGTALSLPIPSRSGRPLSDLATPHGPLHRIVSDLTGGAIAAETLVHLDPDLQQNCVPRMLGWRPSFGQVSSAQQHLARQGVCAGDLFLFFGWFRKVERHHGRWRYVPGAPSIHSLFGWLQVADILIVNADELRTRSPWLADHPHVEHAATIGPYNTLYLAAERLMLGCALPVAPGAGVFSKWSDSLQLTAPGQTRSNWRLPLWMMPGDGHPALTYHTAADRWSIVDGYARLRLVAKGQEFVQDVRSSAEALRWLRSLVAAHA